jgi:hypothetical protein
MLPRGVYLTVLKQCVTINPQDRAEMLGFSLIRLAEFGKRQCLGFSALAA